jgi:CCR4-NOT transcription complex subunit 7/8
MVSGLVLDDRVKWVSFHSGYDYAYLLKTSTTQELPADEKSFFEMVKIYFPTIYDIKFMTSLCDGHFVGFRDWLMIWAIHVLDLSTRLDRTHYLRW